MKARTRFRDRSEAGELLAEKLAGYADRPDVIVLALPRGGVPVAYTVARLLHAPLDVFVVRKLGVPGHEELAMGAIASGGVIVLNDEVLRMLQLSDDAIDEVATQEQSELTRRERLYRGTRPPIDVEGRTVILVDDGIATGATMRAAIQAVRQMGAGRIVVAAPTVARETYDSMHASVDDFVAVIIPEDFFAVGQWFDDFSQTTDDEVRSLLESAARPEAGS
ncbi:MAG TPA: phosphoribosyltransferase [Opitutaceae bacterium]